LAKNSRVFPEKLIAIQLLKKFLTGKFIIVHLSSLADLILHHMNAVHTLPPYFFMVLI